MDAVVAFISRNFPNPVSEAEKIEGRKHSRSFVGNYPHLAGLLTYESTPTLYQGKVAHRGFIPKGSRLAQVLEAFAARVGLALYRNQMGAPAPLRSTIHASWHPNAQLDEDDTINDMLQAMGAPRTIQQGKWHVADQFRFWSSVPDDRPDLFCCFAAFRQSFGVLVIVDPTGEEWRDAEWDQTYEPHRPGFLKGFRA